METTRIDVDRDPNKKCETCSQTWGWHMTNQTQHEFNDGSIPTSETFGKRGADGKRVPAGKSASGETGAVVQGQWPFDPVLRQALINKGVLTPEDLSAAEAQIRAVTAQFQASGGVPS